MQAANGGLDETMELFEASQILVREIRPSGSTMYREHGHRHLRRGVLPEAQRDGVAPPLRFHDRLIERHLVELGIGGRQRTARWQHGNARLCHRQRPGRRELRMPAHEARVVVATEGIALLHEAIAGAPEDHRFEVAAHSAVKHAKRHIDQRVEILGDI